MTIPTIAQTFTAYGPPPVQGMTQAEFDTAASDKMAKDKIHVTEFGTFRTEVNATVAGINQAVIDVEADKSTAVTSAATAVAAATEAGADADRAEAAVAVLPAGTINDLMVAPDKAWSSEKIDATILKTLGEFTVSNWAPGETRYFTLPTPANSLNAIDVTVREQVTQAGITNNNWSIETDDTEWDLHDSAYAASVTPGAVTGETTITLSTGVWSASDVGKRITGNGGVAHISAQDGSAVATIVIATDFTDTSAITSGNWQMYAGEFTGGAFQLAGLEQVDWDAWDGTVDGVAAVFESASTTYISSVALDSTRILVCYNDGALGQAIVLTVNPDLTITPGVPNDFGVAATYISVCLVDTDKAVVCFSFGSTGKVDTITIDGTTITLGGYIQFESGNPAYISVCKLDTDKALVCYSDGGNSNFGTACVLECYGTTVITPGTPVPVFPVAMSHNGLSQLGTDKAIWAVNNTSSLSGMAGVITVTGTVPAMGSTPIFESAAVSYVSVAALSATKAIVAYQDGGNLNYGTACVLDISGTTVTPGAPAVFESAAVYFVSVAALDSNTAAVAYKDGGNSEYGTACVLNVIGSDALPGTPVVYNNAQSDHNSMTKLNSGSVVVGYADIGNSSYGTTKVLNALSSAYVSNQHVPAVINSTGGQVNTEFFTDLNSLTPSDTLNSQSAFYGITMDGSTYQVVGDGETTLRNVVKFDTVWKYNSNVTYGSETWTAASEDSVLVAVKEALALTQNQMSGATAAAVLDATWPDFGLVFGAFMSVYSDSAAVTPTVESIAFNYDANTESQENPLYINSHPALDMVKITSPADGATINCNVRITRG